MRSSVNHGALRNFNNSFTKGSLGGHEKSNMSFDKKQKTFYA